MPLLFPSTLPRSPFLSFEFSRSFPVGFNRYLRPMTSWSPTPIATLMEAADSSLALRSASSSRHAPAASPAASFLTALEWTYGCSILHFSFPESAYTSTPFGVVFDEDYATTLWTSLRLIRDNVRMSPEIVAFAVAHGIGKPPSLYHFPFTPGANVLRSLFRDLGEAHSHVAVAQRSGQEGLQWLVALCRALEHESLRVGAALPPHTTHLLDYYRCLTWHDEDASANTCRALVPYRAPGQSSSSSAFPTPFSGGGSSYDPADPYLIPFPNMSPYAPPASYAVPASSSLPSNRSELLTLFRSLLGQGGVPGLQGIDTVPLARLVEQMEAMQLAQGEDPMETAPTATTTPSPSPSPPPAPEVIEIL